MRDRPMDPPVGELHTRPLRRAKDAQELKLYRAALEWGLADPIVIEGRKDLKSEPRWRELLTPYKHQVTNLITFCRRLPVTLIADDVGLGKTISAGLIMSELLTRARIAKVLIVCPKLLIPQWKEELETKFGIDAVAASGKALLEAEPPGGLGAVLTTYHSARLYLERLPQDRFQMLILDEAHKLRNLYGVNPPPQVAVRFRKALADRQFRYVLMLTATPLHNRLWDLYSLIDLLSVARGHENPFGTEGIFARRFIADERSRARMLNQRMKEEFRSIVYGYMSRIRRGDANLHFPDRFVQLHRVAPTPEEQQLIMMLVKPVSELKNRYSQIGILQSLTSSPDALRSRLKNMARNGTFPANAAGSIIQFIEKMPKSAKLRGLASLVDSLIAKRPDDWRMVIFTGSRETQTTIQDYLLQRHIPVGIINGDSGARNQETIRKFWKTPQECRVIVSTEAGSEGVNLQAANVLVNYDLPWNPMIVEQRIGRIQRLASEHANVSIFNIILEGTFEEFIVGRLMEKLQLASHAIGDVESLLEAAGLGDDDEKGAKSFEEKVLDLVVAALAGKDVEAATRKAEQSIAEAKEVLESEERMINETLGAMDGAEYVGPRAPILPVLERSMEAIEFVATALKAGGARLREQAPGIYLYERDGKTEQIQISGDANGHFHADGPLYAPGSAAFERLVGTISAGALHAVEDEDREPLARASEIARRWVASLGATFSKADVDIVHRSTEGKALVRVRATVAHDSYERLVEVPCSAAQHTSAVKAAALEPLPEVIRIPAAIGINARALSEDAATDSGIAEFCRFYLQRKAEESRAAGEDERKRKKLEDEFTPRLDFDLAALEGKVRRTITLATHYSFDDSPNYSTLLTVVPCTGELLQPPPLAVCEKSSRRAPQTCLANCAISGTQVLRHFLQQSELSGRLALPEHTTACSLTRKRVLNDEVEFSDVTGRLVSRELLKTSAMSGKRGEPGEFARCEFTDSECLVSELLKSEVSGKTYRADQSMQSVVSGKHGHKREFVVCYETRQPLFAVEAERCAATGKLVRPGILEACAVTGERVLPLELERSAASGKRALKQHLVTSSISGVRILASEAILSIAGACCAPREAKACGWSGQLSHPDDLVICDLIGLAVRAEYVTGGRLFALQGLLDQITRPAERTDLWPAIEDIVALTLKVRQCQVEAAQLSPDGERLVVSIQVPAYWGFMTDCAGCLYSIRNDRLAGRLVRGKRKGGKWIVR